MYEVFEQLLKEKGLRPADISKQTGISPSVFSDWKKGRYELKGDKLKLVADALGVSVDYLMTGNIQRDMGAAQMTATTERVSDEVTAINKVIETFGMSIGKDAIGNIVVCNGPVEKTVPYKKYVEFCDDIADYIKDNIDTFLDDNLIELKIKGADKGSMNRLVSYFNELNGGLTRKTEIPGQK